MSRDYNPTAILRETVTVPRAVARLRVFSMA